VEKSPDAFRTISEVAVDLSVPQHVLRFWESRFREIKPMKRGGGRRYYRPDDVDLLRGIRHLLYGEGYTIRGVQRILKEQGLKFVQSVWQPGAPKPAQRPGDEADFATEDVEAHQQQADVDRNRGLFSLLPSLLGSEDDDEEPRELPEIQKERPSRILPSERIVPPPPEPRGMPRADLHKLQAALHELAECRKLLDAALSQKA
jgi:DNA-binding transcriptional MerR regulator